MNKQRLLELAGITEAQYTTSWKGSLEWFLKSFFDRQAEEEDDETTKHYTPKDEFTVLIDDNPISHMAVTRSQKGISTYYIDRYGNEIGTDADPRKELIINMVKQVWPPE